MLDLGYMVYEPKTMSCTKSVLWCKQNHPHVSLASRGLGLPLENRSAQISVEERDIDGQLKTPLERIGLLTKVLVKGALSMHHILDSGRGKY